MGERHWLLHGSGLSLKSLRSVPVVHCSDAWGLVIDSGSGWRFVYSGDTRPSKALVAAGRNATLLVHEATFGDDRAGDAQRKRHCTRAEALSVATQMRAYRTMLTHLSQRYNGAEFSRGGGPAAWADRRSFVAFDSLILNLADLPDLPTYAPAIATFFKRQQLLVERGRQADLAAQIARTARLEREIGMDMERERKKARAASPEILPLAPIAYIPEVLDVLEQDPAQDEI